MIKLIELGIKTQNTFTCVSRHIDFLPSLFIRLYLVPIFWMAGTKKWENMESTIAWFANTDGGLGLPLPTLMAYLATLTEIIGAVFLLFGFATRWISIPLIFTMIVAALTVHIENGWLAIAEGSGFFASDRTIGAIDRLNRAKDILHEHANYNWLTENGSLVISNNGIEFAATYTIMLLALMYLGAGKVSIDYFINKRYMR